MNSHCTLNVFTQYIIYHRFPLSIHVICVSVCYRRVFNINPALITKHKIKQQQIKTRAVFGRGG